jgi:enamine deaminase RidA (YjgF/YER057c/UK114 family)
MKRRPINPWTWQEQYNFSQAWRIDDARSLIFVSGQASVSSEGVVLYEGDFDSQVRQTFRNLETVLKQAGTTLADIVKLGIFLTNQENFPTYKKIHAGFFPGEKPADTVLIVNSLALSELLVEIEAVAAV